MAPITLRGSPPWLCQPCGNGFWNCELTTEARSHFRARFRDWGHGIALRVQLEQARRLEAG